MADGRGTVAALEMRTGPSRLPDPRFWAGRRVLVTGHTGFKGSWLVRWLRLLAADVHGLALDPPTTPALHKVARVDEQLTSDHRVDLRDPAAVNRAVRSVGAEVILHLAAQSLVRDGYRDPAGTFATNVAGTANLLAAVGGHDGASGTVRPAAIVVATTDKVYEPGGSVHPHNETDALGGLDPYAASKAMVEGVVATFRRLPALGDRSAWTAPTATARAGNVIGGGDWSHERLLPDCVRAFARGTPVVLRLPRAIRPWQHVLDPLAGYLLLAEDLALGVTSAPQAVNFGPDAEATVGEVARLAAEAWGDGAGVHERPHEDGPPETGVLRLDSTLATTALGWRPRWDVRTAVVRTIAWHRAHLADEDMGRVMDAQIHEYIDA